MTGYNQVFDFFVISVNNFIFKVLNTIAEYLALLVAHISEQRDNSKCMSKMLGMFFETVDPESLYMGHGADGVVFERLGGAHCQ